MLCWTQQIIKVAPSIVYDRSGARCREDKVIPLPNITGANFDSSLIVPRERDR